jgi:hypothetical protein
MHLCIDLNVATNPEFGVPGQVPLYSKSITAVPPGGNIWNYGRAITYD